MDARRAGPEHDDLDRLRILALGRIPRCQSCPRYRVLTEACRRHPRRPVVLPDIPARCRFVVCEPIAARLRPTEAREARSIAS